MINISDYLFFQRALIRLSIETNRIWRFVPLRKVSLRGIGAIPDKEQFIECFIRLSGGIDKEVFRSITEEDREMVLFSAEQAMSHQFDLLGSGIKTIDPINWLLDFKSGGKWPKGIYYKKQRSITPPGSDIKVPWELSRCQHLLWLGEAYVLTDNDSYAKEIKDEIENWIEENPLMRTVNWTCAMDVAFRAINWIYSIGMILSSKEIDDQFVAKAYKSLYQHAFFIYHNLEKITPYSNNHYFSDIVGLLYLSVLFYKTKKGESWYNFALKEYYYEIRTQILPTGPQFERSISYHRMMTELCSYPYYMLKRIGVNIPADISYRIGTMYDFVAHYTKQNGMAPLIEDNDDGRFLPFLKRDFRNHSYLIDKNSVENSIALSGQEFLYIAGNNLGTIIYKDAGHCIIRKQDAYVFVTNGGQSLYCQGEQRMVGTHTHNDLLSFELCVGEDDIIIDPGSYVYTPDPERSREFRSTLKHNTAFVDDEEQNELSQDSVFQVKSNSLSMPLSLVGNDICKGEYVTTNGQMHHYREFILEDNAIIINDVITKKGDNHKAFLSFHLAPEVSVCKEKSYLTLVSRSYTALLSVDTINPTNITVDNDTVSPSYGVLKPSQTIRLEFSFSDKSEIKTRITWKKR